MPQENICPFQSDISPVFNAAAGRPMSSGPYYTPVRANYNYSTPVIAIYNYSTPVLAIYKYSTTVLAIYNYSNFSLGIYTIPQQ